METAKRSVRHPASDRRSRTIEKLIDARNAARKAKNFKESDRIRDELKAMGVLNSRTTRRHDYLGGRAMMTARAHPEARAAAVPAG